MCAPWKLACAAQIELLAWMNNSQMSDKWVFCNCAAPVCDEAPESLGVKEDGSPTGWITTATAVRILDDISQCAEVTTHTVPNAVAWSCLSVNLSPTLPGRACRMAAVLEMH